MRINSINPSIQRFYNFQGATSPKKKAELEARANTVKTLLQSAIDEERKMDINEIMASTGYNLNEVRYVFKNYADINALWQKVHTGSHDRVTPEEKQARLQKIKAVLEEAKRNNVKMTLDELSRKTGINKDTVAHYVTDESLACLWFWAKSKAPSSFTKEEKEDQSARIKEQLLFAIEQKKAITINELTEAVGETESVVEDRIKDDKTLSDLREQTLALEDKNRKYEIGQIRIVLQEAKETNLKITQTYISQRTSIPVSLVQKRISENAALERLFKSVRAREHTHSTKEEMQAQNARIAAVLEEAAKNNQTMTFSMVAEKIDDMKQGTVTSRIRNVPKLAALWEKVKDEDTNHPAEDEVLGQIKKIEEILTDVKNKNEKISLAKIAQMTGMTRRVVHTRIQGSKTLSALWNVTMPYSNSSYTQDELDVQNIMIERILAQRIKDGIKPSYSQIGQYLDLSKDTVKQRIESDIRLLALFNRALNP